ncbi:MAG: putative peptidoglycan binding domain protein [Candidatus Sulfotelmatobacter sp.]|nr:putative peptidoglycan binding domain protein [Candidatus Sulfotelmatobacter sp.]
MSGRRFSRTACSIILAMISASSAIYCAAGELPPSAPSSNSSAYVKVQLDHSLKLSKLKQGDLVEGKLARPIYSGEREIFLAGSSIRLTVDHLEKRRRAADDHWPWVVKAFTPRHEKYPVFATASVSALGSDNTLHVSLVSISRRREVHAQSKRKKAGAQAEENGAIEASTSARGYGSKNSAAPVLVLEASNIEDKDKEDSGDKSTSSASAGPDLSALETLPAGTAFKILLLQDVSASKSKPGDIVSARLLEPVYLNSRLALPAGTLVEGSVVKRTPPRWGSRAGSLYLAFTGVTLPDGNFLPIAASLAGAELDRSSHTRIDAEGRLHGERPGKAWMAINLGMTAGLAKEVDDATQLIVEALISTATDASTAGTARILSSCISGIYMVTRHGRDVVLPRFTEMDIALDRPLAVTKNAESAPSSGVVRGN